MPRDTKLPPGITETPDGSYDVRIGYQKHRFYIGVYQNKDDAIEDLAQFRKSVPAMMEQGADFVHAQLRTLRQERARERKHEGITYHKPKDSLRHRLDTLEQRVKVLENNQ